MDYKEFETGKNLFDAEQGNIPLEKDEMTRNYHNYLKSESELSDELDKLFFPTERNETLRWAGLKTKEKREELKLNDINEDFKTIFNILNQVEKVKKEDVRESYRRNLKKPTYSGTLGKSKINLETKFPKRLEGKFKDRVKIADLKKEIKELQDIIHHFIKQKY